MSASMNNTKEQEPLYGMLLFFNMRNANSVSVSNFDFIALKCFDI